MLACEIGDLALVRQLVHSGVDPSTVWDFPSRAFRHKKSALMWATRFNHLGIVDFLIESGADYQYSIEWDGNVLHAAAFWNCPEIGQFLLGVMRDTETRNRPWEETPLHVACGQLSLEFVSMLLKSGADVNALDHIGCTPMDKASLYADRRAYELLRIHGGKHGCFGSKQTS